MSRSTQSAVVALVVLSVATLSPAAARAYDARHVFVTNRGAGNILELDESLTVVATWFVTDGLSAPNGMAFTPDGSLWVADTSNNRILAFDTAGLRVGTIDTATRLGGSVESIYFGGDGTLYATANPGLGVVARYTITRDPLPDVVADAAYLNLGNVNLTNARHVVVSDFSGAMRGLRELDPTTGAVLATFGTDLGRQEDVMVDGADRIFVSHFEGDEIVVFGPDRAELYRFTAPSSEPLALDSPTGIALTYDCRILVVSFVNGTLFEWHHRGSNPPDFVGSMTVPGLSQPESIAVAGLALPGGFLEFTDVAPRCDPPIVLPDAGVASDAGTVDAGAADAGVDAGRGGRTPAPESSCGCRAAGNGGGTGASIASGLIALALAMFRHRRQRA